MNTTKTDRYQMHSGFFRGPGTYGVNLQDGSRLNFDVDADGYFDFPSPQPVPIGILARYVDNEGRSSDQQKWLALRCR